MITEAMIRKAVGSLQVLAVKPHTIKTEKEAQVATDIDPAGHVWHVGESYYELHGDFGPIYARPQ